MAVDSGVAQQPDSRQRQHCRIVARGAVAPLLLLRRVLDAKQKWRASWMTPARQLRFVCWEGGLSRPAGWRWCEGSRCGAVSWCGARSVVAVDCAGGCLEVIVESFLLEDALERGTALDGSVMVAEGRGVPPAALEPAAPASEHEQE
jgi:hypothetical protein